MCLLPLHWLSPEISFPRSLTHRFASSGTPTQRTASTRTVNNIRDYVRDGLLKVFHIGTNDNAADFFTKPLTGEKYIRFRDFLMGDYIRRDEVALMLFARIPSIRPGPNPSVQRR